MVLTRAKIYSGIRRWILGEETPSPVEREWQRLRSIPRYQQTVTTVLGAPLLVPDAPSFLAQYEEIFKHLAYEFRPRTDGQPPIILDCGANIGVSLIYFGQKYANAVITAFEADPQIFSILQQNIDSFGLRNITALNLALWDTDGDLDFAADGADAGSLVAAGQDGTKISVKSARLAPYLENRAVDLLKLDIEGAEMRVLSDCGDLLDNVRNLFVEYHSYSGSKQELADLCALLQKSGFRLYVQSVYGAFHERPFYDSPTAGGMDMQLNIWAYRVCV